MFSFNMQRFVKHIWDVRENMIASIINDEQAPAYLSTLLPDMTGIFNGSFETSGSGCSIWT